MKARRLFVSIGFLGIGAAMMGQVAQETSLTADDAALNNLPRLVMPVSYATRPLPAKKDNTRVIYFSGIYSQEVWNCNQASSIWTMFTYEINYLRNLNSSLPENQYSPMAVYNLLNYANPVQGVSYFDSWNLVKANGIPANPDFTAYNQNSTTWMTGYDKYLRGMKNRVDEVFAIDVGTPDGLLTLKHWINDHLDGSQIGGLANFQIGSGDMIIPQIPLDKNLEEEGQYIVIKYGPYVGHAMTFAGWNDSVRYDVNQDGRYTNNIDINGDKVVDMKDWEIGAMLVVNSWSVGWGNAGKVWVMYRLLAERPETGGIWNNAAMVVRPKKTYNPLLTVKTSIRYNERNRLKLQVGVSSDLNAIKPDKVMDFPCFNYQGDAIPMQGFVAPNSDSIEIGLDITPLMNYIPENGQAKIFLEVVQKSPDATAQGRIEHFSVIDYTNGTHEYTNTDGFTQIRRNTITRLSVPINTRVNRPVILTEELPEALVGQEYRIQLEADGTTSPFRYANPATWFVEKPVDPSITLTGGTDVFTEPGITSRVMDLPFSFKFYGKSYNQVTVLADGGMVMGQGLVIYPYVIDYRLQFYQNDGIFPFFAKLYYPSTDRKVTFETNATEAIVRWRASADPEGFQPIEFAARITAGGDIKFAYGTMATSPDMAWISGLSAGNNLDFYLMDHTVSGIGSNTAFSLDLLDWPAWLSLGSNGDLHGTPDHSGFYTLPFRVTDWSGISNNKELTLNVKGGSGVITEGVQSSFRIYPNPVTEATCIEGYTERSGSLILTIFDMTGHRLTSRTIAVASGRVVIPVEDAATLPSGVYFIQLKGIADYSGKIIRQ